MKLETRNQKQNNRRGAWLTQYLPLFIWIGVIFFLSSSQGSMGRTSLIIRPILEFLFPAAPEETLLFYHGIIRKLAHFTEYAVLGFLASRAFFYSLRGMSVGTRFILAAALVVIVATLDETNQSFNPLRTGSPWDVLIDLSGGLAAVGLYYFLARHAPDELSVASLSWRPEKVPGSGSLPDVSANVEPETRASSPLASGEPD